MKVEERPPPPEPEAEEAPTGIPWSQRLRGWGLQLLAPAVSLLIAAVIGILVILVVALIVLAFAYDSRTKGNVGTEIELTWRPRLIDGLELKGNVVAQNPKVDGARYQITQEDKDPQGVITGYHYVQISEDGRRPRRLKHWRSRTRSRSARRPRRRPPPAR